MFCISLPSIGKSDYVVSVSIDFPSNSKRDVPSHCAAFDYSRADLDGLPDHLRDNPWENIFKLDVSTAAEFCEWVQVKIDVYIPKCKDWFKSYSFHGFKLLVLLP